MHHCLSISRADAVFLLTIRLSHLLVCVSGVESALWQNGWLDLTAFGMVNGLGQVMGDCRRRRGSFGGEFRASHCNKWGLCCIAVQKCVNWSSCQWHGEWRQPRHSCIGRGFTCPKRKGLFWEFLGICTSIGLNGQNVLFFAQKCTRLVREKMTVFPYGQVIIRI